MGSLTPSTTLSNVLRLLTCRPRPRPQCRAPRWPSVRAFTSSITHHERSSTLPVNVDTEERGSKDKRRSTRGPKPNKTSLRRVAVEAERSRGLSRRALAKRSPTEQDTDAKVVTAYCGAEQYNIPLAAKILKGVGYTLDPSTTDLYPQVLHIQSSNVAIEEKDGRGILGDIFVFPSGTVVTWNVDEATAMNLVTSGLMPAAENPRAASVETEDLEYIENEDSERSKVVGDKISIGLKANPQILADETAEASTATEDSETQLARQHEANVVLAKIAFSSGLARSVKLAVLEIGLEKYFQSTKSIPDLMAQGSRIPFTRRFIIRKTGELLKLRASLNLNSELTDSLPDMFWDSRHELGLESYYEQVGRCLDVGIRSKILNQKMDYAQEIVAVLREQLSEKHGLTLEWLIIGLIAIEVLFEIRRLVREYWNEHDQGQG